MNVKNARVKCNGTKFGHVCNARCVRGYTSSGAVKHTCNEAGQWTGNPTKCRLVSCGKLGSPKFGSRGCGGYTYNKSCNFSCRKGYALSGSPRRKCRADGKW